MKICITGDSILMENMPESYRGLAPIRDYIAQADVRINNMEMVLSNYDRFASTYCGGLWLTAEPAVLDDILKYGFNCFGFANNHTMDYSYGGVESTLEALKAKNMPVCGAGMSLAEATAPAMVDTKEGKVAVLSITSTCDDAARAGDPGHMIPARPGLNMLRHSETFLVNADHMKALEEIADATHINGRINNSKRGGYTVSKPGIFNLGTAEFKLSEVEGKSSAPHPQDMERMRLAVEAAKKDAEYVVVCFHSHEIKGELDEEPDYFIEEFARKCIDWGACAVVGSGTHQIKAIEMYKGKPIFYSIANFIFQSEKPKQFPPDYHDRYGIDRSLTAQEAMYIRSDGGKRGLETEFKNYKGLMPLLEFEGDTVKKITIKPVELGFYHEDKSVKGLPHNANDAVTQEVLETLQNLSAEYGTKLVRNGDLIEIVL
ncbi:MAG: CapA family protein [Oscillospiraceae bacterium]|nr:CapA family protein [Oscillospiraceae bacterium]